MHCTATVAIALSCSVGLALHAAAPAAIIYVDDSATGANNGTSWNDAFLDLQSALAMAQSGDEIRIGQGLYKPTTSGDREASFHIVNGTLVQGGFAGAGSLDPDEWDPETYPAVLTGDLLGNDAPNHQNFADNSYNVLIADATALETTLRGVTIRGGNANYFDGNWDDRRSAGGGVTALNGGALTLIDCIVRENRADWTGGGGLRLFGAFLTRCQFIDNRADTPAQPAGGALFLSGPAEMTDCLFQMNRSQNVGGAIQAWTFSDQIIIKRCRFIGNGSNEPGGAISGVNYRMIDCDFIGNGSGHGAGAALVGQSTIVNCRFLNNGSGCHIANGSAVSCYDNVKIINCLFSGNEGSYGAVGAYTSSPNDPILIANCTFVGNRGMYCSSGAAIFANDATTVVNTIIWGNEYEQSSPPSPNPVQDSQIRVQPNTVLANNIIQGWDGTLPGTNNTGEDPQFIDADGPDDDPGTIDDNPRLSDASPARDTGDNALLPNDEFDLDGDGNTSELLPLDLEGLRRIVNGVVDLGPYEWQRPDGCDADVSPSAPGLAGDGNINVNDLLTIINNWGACDQCVADIDGDGLVNVNDLLAIILAWGACP